MLSVRILSVAVLMTLPALSWAGESEGGNSLGGGGNAVICFSSPDVLQKVRKQKDRIRSEDREQITLIEMLDLYEAKLKRGLDPRKRYTPKIIQPLENETPNQYAQRIIDRLRNSVPELAEKLSEMRDIRSRKIRWTPFGVKRIEDENPVGLINPEICMIKTLAVHQMDNSRELDIDQSLYFLKNQHTEHSVLSQAVLWLHEYVYMLGRENGDHKDSRNTRRLVSMLITDQPMLMKEVVAVARDLGFSGKKRFLTYPEKIMLPITDELFVAAKTEFEARTKEIEKKVEGYEQVFKDSGIIFETESTRHSLEIVLGLILLNKEAGRNSDVLEKVYAELNGLVEDRARSVLVVMQKLFKKNRYREKIFEDTNISLQVKQALVDYIEGSYIRFKARFQTDRGRMRLTSKSIGKMTREDNAEGVRGSMKKDLPDYFIGLKGTELKFVGDYMPNKVRINSEHEPKDEWGTVTGGAHALVCFDDPSIPSAIADNGGFLSNQYLDQIESVEAYWLYDAKLARGVDANKKLSQFYSPKENTFYDFLNVMVALSAGVGPGIKSIIGNAIRRLPKRNQIIQDFGLIPVESAQSFGLIDQDHCVLSTVMSFDSQNFTDFIHVDDRLFSHEKMSPESRATLFAQSLMMLESKKWGHPDFKMAKDIVQGMVTFDVDWTIDDQVDLLNRFAYGRSRKYRTLPGTMLYEASRLLITNANLGMLASIEHVPGFLDLRSKVIALVIYHDVELTRRETFYTLLKKIGEKEMPPDRRREYERLKQQVDDFLWTVSMEVEGYLDVYIQEHFNQDFDKVYYEPKSARMFLKYSLHRVKHLVGDVIRQKNGWDFDYNIAWQQELNKIVDEAEEWFPTNMNGFMHRILSPFPDWINENISHYLYTTVDGIDSDRKLIPEVVNQ